MRALLTGGIKAILAVAALSTAAHWTLRVQRESAISVAAAASAPDPTVTGSIAPRGVERPLAAVSPPPAPAAVAPAAGTGQVSGLGQVSGAGQASGLDQTHLAALMAGATPPGKGAKAVSGTAAAKTAAAKTAAAKLAAAKTAAPKTAAPKTAASKTAPVAKIASAEKAAVAR